MPSLDIQRLWKLHKIDSGLVDIRNQAASLDPGKAIRQEVEKLKLHEAEVGGHYRALNQEMLDLDLQQKAAADKIKKVEKELYGGLIVSARESEAYQKEIEMLKKHRESHDERLLELYELVPPAKVEADKIHQQIEAKRVELGEANKKAQTMKTELEREFARLSKLRPEAAKIVNPTLLARYRSIRLGHKGIGMAEVTKKRIMFRLRNRTTGENAPGTERGQGGHLRIVPPNPVSHGRRDLTRRWLIQAIGTVMLGMILPGCAISPANANGQSTRLTFTVQLNGPIAVQNQYIYGIVMNLATGGTSPPLTSTQNQIYPVLQQGTVNGMFTGFATNALMILNVANTGNPVAVYDFGGVAVDTGGLQLPGPSGYTIDQLPPPDINGDIPGTLTFTVTLNQLQPMTLSQPINPQSFQWIQFQVVTMNKTTLGGTSGRYIDAMGVSPNFVQTSWLSIASSISYGQFQLYPGGLTGTTTPGGGDPALSLQSVSLNVSVP